MKGLLHMSSILLGPQASWNVCFLEMGSWQRMDLLMLTI